MKTVNIRQARQQLSEIVAAAERGESIVITRRGKEVACLKPVSRRHRKGMPDLTEFRESVRSRGKPLSQIVVENRREARY